MALHMDKITQALEAEGFAVALMHTGAGNYSLVLPKRTSVDFPVHIGPFTRSGHTHDFDQYGDPIVYVGLDEEMRPEVPHLTAKTVEEVLDDVVLFLSA
jgi:hypothetical protein